MTWLWSNVDLVLALTLRHATLAIWPIVVGFLISIPLGYAAFRAGFSARVVKSAGRALLVAAALLYTIPSLPMFVILPAITGLSLLDPLNVLIGLTIYAVALMVGVAADAFASVDDDTRRAATAMGTSSWQRFWRVELPLAGPVLLSGVRVVSVSTISLLTIGQLVGVTTLGYLFTNGFQRQIQAEVLTGIVAVVLIALVYDLVLVAVGRVLLPWVPRTTRRRAPLTQEAAR